MQVTENIGQLTSLTSLSLLQCPYLELSGSISRLQNLRDLDLQENHFAEVNALPLCSCGGVDRIELVLQSVYNSQ